MSSCAKQSAALAVNHSGLPSNPRISVPDSSVRAPDSSRMGVSSTDLMDMASDAHAATDRLACWSNCA